MFLIGDVFSGLVNEDDKVVGTFGLAGTESLDRILVEPAFFSLGGEAKMGDSVSLDDRCPRRFLLRVSSCCCCWWR